jgi:predicted RecB family nuclease
MTEMSKVFNSQDLSLIKMEDKTDATFDRLFKLLEKCEVISRSAESLGVISGITGDESKDINRIKIRVTPESIADNMGNIAGSKRKD